jgi:DNA-binding transcriptional ArsR family regulator
MVQYQRLDAGFSALSDQTRRGVLERLSRGDASIGELAGHFGMTLTGMKKHVGILEATGLVATRKVGRVRRCSLGRRRLDLEAMWLERHRIATEARLDRLAAYLERKKGP